MRTGTAEDDLILDPLRDIALVLPVLNMKYYHTEWLRPRLYLMACTKSIKMLFLLLDRGASVRLLKTSPRASLKLTAKQ